MSVDYDELRENFISTSNEMLDQSENIILKLENVFNEELLNNLFRHIHTIKGNAGIFDYKNFSSLAHSFESYLNLLRHGDHHPDQKEADLMLRTVDRLRNMLGDVENADFVFQDIKEEFEILLTQLRPAPEGGVKTVAEKVVAKQKNAGQIKISRKYVEAAQQKELYLSYGCFDLSNQNIVYLSEWVIRLDQLKERVVGLKKAPLLNDQGDSISDEGLLYSLLILSKEPVEELIQELDLKPLLFKRVHEPERAKADAESPATDGAPVAQKAVEARSGGGESHIRVKIGLLNRLINLTGEAVLARNELVNRIAEMDDTTLAPLGKKIDRLITEIQGAVLQTRLQKLQIFFMKVPRMVRDISQELDKEVEVVIEGGEVELDKHLLDTLNDPLTHMIRNAMDHGIESKAERVKAGKSENGTLRLAARLQADKVLLEISDDGRGLNLDVIRKKAVEKGLKTEEEAAAASEADVIEYLFLAGFSTAAAVSNLSGRGVGLDVVKSNIRNIGGTIDVEGSPGNGINFKISLPQTISIVKVLIVYSGGRYFAVAEQAVLELLKIDRNKLKKYENLYMYDLRGKLLPVLGSRSLFFGEEGINESEKYIMVVRTDKFRYGVAVDDIKITEEVVVKNLGRHFVNLDYLSGGAIMGDGTLALILDIPGLARQEKLNQNEYAAYNEMDEVMTETISNDADNYLIFELYKQVVALPIRLVPRIEKAFGGQIQDMMGMEVFNYRDRWIPVIRLESLLNITVEGTYIIYYILIFESEGQPFGILGTDVFEVMDKVPHLKMNETPELGVLGQGIVRERPTLLLDPMLYFEEYKQVHGETFKHLLVES